MAPELPSAELPLDALDTVARAREREGFDVTAVNTRTLLALVASARRLATAEQEVADARYSVLDEIHEPVSCPCDEGDSRVDGRTCPICEGRGEITGEQLIERVHALAYRLATAEVARDEALTENETLRALVGSGAVGEFEELEDGWSPEFFDLHDERENLVAAYYALCMGDLHRAAARLYGLQGRLAQTFLAQKDDVEDADA